MKTIPTQTREAATERELNLIQALEQVGRDINTALLYKRIGKRVAEDLIETIVRAVAR